MALSASIVLAEHRFGYGPKGGRVSASGDGRDWLLAQLKQSPTGSTEFSGLKGAAEILPISKDLQQQIKDLKGDEERNKNALKELQQQYTGYYQDEIGARFHLLAGTDTPFLERLAWFWSNHFSVSGEKHVILPLLGAYEREALRPHIMGYFADLLKSATQHPAMIMYLDNQTSISPEVGEKRRQQRMKRGLGPPEGPTGINENLAREILELHTLGVDGGYTQTDVTCFAHVLTGWNVRLNENLIKQMDSASDNGTGFGFARVIHDGTPQTILGKTYDQEGMAQGEAVLSDLAHHPATASHIAHKLAQHFIADDPPAVVTQRLADSFTKSGGHLPTVYKVLIESDEAWQPHLIKSKTAVEYVATTLRLFPKAHPEPQKIIGMLNQMGQKPWFAPSPQGWPDVASRWITPDGLWKRVEWAETIATKAGEWTDARALADGMYGPLLSDTTRTGIAQAETGEQALALLLLSPEFQRR